MTDLNEFMEQAKQMQERFKDAQKEIEKLIVYGESGAGLVKVKMNGRHDLIDVELDDSLFQEGKPVVEDLIAAAVNDAVRKLDYSRQNLERVADIVQELHRQVESLKRQAVKAERQSGTEALARGSIGSALVTVENQNKSHPQRAPPS